MLGDEIRTKDDVEVESAGFDHVECYLDVISNNVTKFRMTFSEGGHWGGREISIIF